jgi:cullin 3
MFESGLISLVDNQNYTDLAKLYSLFIRVPEGISHLKNQLGSYLKKKAAIINMQGSENIGKTKSSFQKLSFLNWVESMLSLKEEFDRILENSFAKDKTIGSHLHFIMEMVVNENPRCAEYISLFIDENLKKGLKGVGISCSLTT